MHWFSCVAKLLYHWSYKSSVKNSFGSRNYKSSQGLRRLFQETAKICKYKNYRDISKLLKC